MQFQFPRDWREWRGFDKSGHSERLSWKEPMDNRRKQSKRRPKNLHPVSLPSVGDRKWSSSSVTSVISCSNRSPFLGLFLRSEHGAAPWRRFRRV